MPTTRRTFLGTATAAGLGLAAPALFAQAAESSSLARDPRRPQFHLLPAQNWMNDPNGPIYFAGKYHMFFQYNPQAAVWGNMSWDHATSPDMLHWTHQPLAFTMSPGGPDSAGCFSGSCLAVQEADRQRVYAIYTGVVRDKQHETIRNEGLRESQLLAWSDDPGLLRWTKLPPPVLPAPPPHLPVVGFRDPSMWKQGDLYYMTVGSGLPQKGGCVLLYSSKDLRTWDYLHPLAGGEWDGKPTSNPVADGEMWECPDFFPLDGGHVLIYSTQGKVFWQSGVLDQAELKFHARKTGLLDLDAFYAPKTQLDAQGRRILWGWIPERRSDAEMIKAGWSGMMALPRLMNLDPDGTLRLRILPQSSVLRGASLPLAKPGQGTLKKACGELSCIGKPASDFECNLSTGSLSLMTIAYSAAAHSFTVDDKTIALEPGDIPQLHAFVDGSVIELILSERVGYTKRFYYESAVAPDIDIALKGPATLRLWNVKPISNDRLTTPARTA